MYSIMCDRESIAKAGYMHHLETRWFIVESNLAPTHNHVL